MIDARTEELINAALDEVAAGRSIKSLVIPT